MKRALFAVALLAAAAGCGGPQQQVAGGPRGRPEWVDGPSRRYHDIEFLTGVGRGPLRSPCEDDAYAALAKIFIARVTQVSQDWQSYFSQINSREGGVRIEALSLSQLTQVTTDKVLKGARIAEHWEGEGTQHCLAVLERMPASRSLREEIALFDAEVVAQIKRGDGATTPTMAFMAYASAMEAMQRREALNVDLRILDPRGAGVPPPVEWAALVAKFTTSKARVKVGLKLGGAEASRVQTCLAEELTRIGIEVLERTSDVDMMIHGTLRFQDAGMIAGSAMVRGEINLRIADVENGRTLAAFTDTVKVGRPEMAQSMQLATFKLCQQVAPRLAEKVRESFRR